MTVVMEAVSIGEPVMDFGTDPETGAKQEIEGVQFEGREVTFNTFRVTQVVAGEGVQPGDEVVVVLMAFDYAERTDAGRRAPSPADARRHRQMRGGALQRRRAVRRDVADVWLEAHAAVDASGRVGGFGDDDPPVAALVSGPPSGNSKEVGR